MVLFDVLGWQDKQGQRESRECLTALARKAASQGVVHEEVDRYLERKAAQDSERIRVSADHSREACGRS